MTINSTTGADALGTYQQAVHTSSLQMRHSELLSHQPSACTILARYANQRQPSRC